MNRGIEEFIRNSRAPGGAIAIVEGVMCVNMCKSVPECIEQVYWVIYYKQLRARGAIAIVVKVNVCKCV